MANGKNIGKHSSIDLDISFRGWSVLLLAPAVAIVAAACAGKLLVAHWTQTSEQRRAVIAQFFPTFLLGALFGKLMDDGRSVCAIAHFMSGKLEPRREIFAVVLAGALVPYDGVSLFVAWWQISRPDGTAISHAQFGRLAAAAVRPYEHADP